MSDEAWRRRKQTRDELAAVDEAGLREGERIGRKLDRIKRALGKKKPRDERGDATTDEETFLALERFVRTRGTVRLTSRWRPGVIYRGTTRDIYKAVSDMMITDEEDEDAATVWVPAWKHTGDKLKTFAWIMVMSQERQRSRTINLNLGPDVIAMARRAADTRGLGFARFMRERIAKALMRELDPLGLPTPEFFIWVEGRTEAKAHVHGGIIMPEGANALLVMRAVRKALKAAGGAWNPAEHENQLRMRNLRDAGWGRYVSKWRLLSRRQLQTDNTVAATSGLRARGATWYAHARESGEPIKQP